jgi:hypothetical protein
MLMSVALLPACRSTQTVTDTNGNHVASNIQRDSIYLHDSIFVRIRADTVYLEKWHTRWRDRVAVKTDTITLTKTKTETIEKPYVPTFYKYSTAFAVLFVLYLLVKLLLTFFPSTQTGGKTWSASRGTS